MVEKDLVAIKAIKELIFVSFFKVLLLWLVSIFLGQWSIEVFPLVWLIVLLWIGSELFLIFIPNFIRHRKRWRLYQKYRDEAKIRVEEIGARRTIYSDLLDRF